jgi:cytochrome c553
MRRIIFILMIALLPLRGWMGEAMATEMAAMNIVATQATNTRAAADIAPEKSMSDCDMHKAAKAESSEAQSSCTHCQACHATGLLSVVQITDFDQVRYAQPLARNNQFASANIAHSQKPPIV